MERIVTFVNDGPTMYGILHLPEKVPTNFSGKVGIMILHAGRQARRGPHRFYVKVARALCQAGLPVFRYDGSGYGDSEGVETQTFEAWLADAICALRVFVSECGLDKVIIWGLCGGAILAVHTAARSPGRVDSLILCAMIFNPERLNYKRPLLAISEKLSAFAAGLRRAAGAPLDYLKLSAFRAKRLVLKAFFPAPFDREFDKVVVKYMRSLPETFSKAACPTLFIFATEDPLAGGFRDELFGNRRWHQHLAGIPTELYVVEGADHNFSSADDENAVIQRSVEWAVRRAVAPGGLRPAPAGQPA